MISAILVLSGVWFGGTRTFVFEEGLNGYSGFEDTSIFSENTNSGGATTGVFSGTTNQLFDRRALVRVEIPTFNQFATVLSAELRFTVERSGGNFGNVTYTLHRLTKDWGEGDADGPLAGGFGEPASPGDATWQSNRHTFSTWDSPGGDFVPTPSAMAVAGQQGSVLVFAGAGLEADIQSWILAPSTNHGWIIISAIEGQIQRVKRFYSAEAATDRPRLSMTVDAPLGPPGSLGMSEWVLAVAAIALVSLGIRRRRPRIS